MARYPNGVNFRFQRPPRPESDKAIFELLRAMRGYRNCDIVKKTFLSSGTVAKIRNRRTRYPQHLTMTAIARAVGLKYELVPVRGNAARKTARTMIDVHESRADQ